MRPPRRFGLWPELKDLPAHVLAAAMLDEAVDGRHVTEALAPTLLRWAVEARAAFFRFDDVEMPGGTFYSRDTGAGGVGYVPDEQP